ncbi:MAG: Metal-dependent hydrolase YbeY, involved in rRNA and/or ribosome maturation and assembly, partial [uncultured Nocardioidaceae bacterium]
ERGGARGVGLRHRPGPAGPVEPLRPGAAPGPPAGRAVHQAGRRGHDRRAQPAVDGQGGLDRRPRLADGRAAPGAGQRGARGGRPRGPRRLPGGRGTSGRRGTGRRSHRLGGRRRDRPAHRARHPAPARVRPRRARGARRDVRPAGHVARRVAPVPRRERGGRV